MAELNRLDRIIAAVAPGWGAKRAQARALIEALSYEGAKSGRRTEHWRTRSGASADVEVTQFLGLMRDRARDLVRNNPHASKALGVIVSNKIGTGIMCQPAEARLDGSRANRRKNQRLHERWKRWIDHCDLGGRLDWYGIQALVERSRSEAGEVLVRFLPKEKMAHKDDVPFRLQVLEPDYLDSTRHLEISQTGRFIKHGIEYENGAPVAYWLYDVHPGDDAPQRLRRGGFVSSRVPASEVIHFFKPLRAGQTRGITDFAPVMLRLRALDDYDDAEVMRKKIAACLAAFVTSPAGLPAASLTKTQKDEDDRRIEQLEPGVVAYLKPGESVATADPKPSGDYQPFNLVQLHAIAAGVGWHGIPYELLSGDLSNVNYSSLRGGLVQFGLAVEMDQWQLLVPQLCRRVCARFAVEAALIDSAIDPSAAWEFTPPRFQMLDPGKEIPAVKDAIQSGLITWSNAIRREGYDPAEQLDAIEAEQKEFQRRGVVLTSDPRTEQKQAVAASPPQGEPSPTKPPARPTEEEDEAEAA